MKKKDLFLKLIAFFSDKEIEYIIVGNTDNYPEIIESDVDIVVNNIFFHNGLDSFIRDFSDFHDLHFTQALCHESCAVYYTIESVNVDGSSTFLQPDICADYLRNGKLFIKSKTLLEDRVYQEEKGFYIANTCKEFLYYFLKKVDKGSIDNEQFYYLSKVWKKDEIGCQKMLSRYFSPDNVFKITTCFKSLNKEELKKSINFLRENLHDTILGPDGAGKTTIINNLRSYHPAFRGNAYFHFSPGLIIRKNRGESVTSPHNFQVRKYFSSNLKIMFLVFEYGLGWIFKIFPLLVKSKFVIFDRYFDDIFADKVRYRHGGGEKILYSTRMIIPNPCIYFILSAHPKTLQARKQEVSYKESERAMRAYKKLALSLPNAYVINAEKKPETITREINYIIMKFMADRMKRNKSK